MSQVSQPTIRIPNHAAALVAGLLALAAVATVMLVLALGGSSSEDTAPAAVGAQSVLRVDGGPEESRVAAAVGTRQAAPDESAIAAAIAAR